jgi:hypothetical protein
MADTKISALPAASTPLAGTEVLPIVQGGITEQVSVANLTAGRAVGALSFSATQAITGGSGFQASGLSAYRASGASVSSPGDASMYFNAATGQTFQARAGSSYDWSLINPGNASYIARVPTGTLNLEIAGGNLAFSTSGKGIDFSATPGTGTSELLADYEEGTWTPNLAGTEVLTDVAGVYTKIGRQVTVSFKYTVTTLGTGSPTTISGLPFTSSSLIHGGVITYFENIAANVTYLTLRTNASANTLQLSCLTAAGATIQNVSINQNTAVIYGTVTYFV